MGEFTELHFGVTPTGCFEDDIQKGAPETHYCRDVIRTLSPHPMRPLLFETTREIALFQIQETLCSEQLVCILQNQRTLRLTISLLWPLGSLRSHL